MIIDGSGRGLNDVTVRLTLIAPLNPFLLNGSGEVIQRVAVDTDHDGVWTALLTPNSQFESPDTYWLVDETEAPDGRLWPITMPDDPNTGPVTHNLRDLLIDAPTDNRHPMFEYALGDLTDVDTSGETLNDVLAYGSAGQWVPVPIQEVLSGSVAEYAQAVPAATWTWRHGLGRYPVVDVLDGQRNLVLVSVRHIDPNTLTVSWGAPATGYIEAR